MQINLNEISDVVLTTLKKSDVSENLYLFLKKNDFSFLGHKVDDFVDMAFLLSSVIEGKYKVNTSTKMLITMELIYFMVPSDLIPDFVPAIGYLDDLTLLSFVYKKIKAELKEYKLTDEYKRKKAIGPKMETLFPLETVEKLLNPQFIKEMKSGLKELFKNEPVLEIENMQLVKFDEHKDYNVKGWQDETKQIFQNDLEEVVFIFNNLLYNSNGKVEITEKDIINELILHDASINEVVKKVLDNAANYYNHNLFTNFKSTTNAKGIKVSYTFEFDIVNRKEDMFIIESCKIDNYKDANKIVYNIHYNLETDFVNKYTYYEIVRLIKQAKGHKFDVNYLITIKENRAPYSFTYNSIKDEIRMSTFKNKDIFVENDIEELLNKKVGKKFPLGR